MLGETMLCIATIIALITCVSYIPWVVLLRADSVQGYSGCFLWRKDARSSVAVAFDVLIVH